MLILSEYLVSVRVVDYSSLGLLSENKIEKETVCIGKYSLPVSGTERSEPADSTHSDKSLSDAHARRAAAHTTRRGRSPGPSSGMQRPHSRQRTDKAWKAADLARRPLFHEVPHHIELSLLPQRAAWPRVSHRNWPRLSNSIGGILPLSCFEDRVWCHHQR